MFDQKNPLHKELLTKLKEYSDNPKLLNDNNNFNNKHSIIIKNVALIDIENFDLNKIFNNIVKDDIFKDTDIINIYNNILNTVRDISTIKLDYLDEYDVYNSKSLNLKPEILAFLSKYLIKRRSIYLYIYTLLKIKNLELDQILKLISNKYDQIKKITLPELNLREILLSLQNNLKKKIKTNDKLTNEIDTIFNTYLSNVNIENDKINYNDLFSSLGVLLSELNKKANGYKALVTDVIPLMAGLNDDKNGFNTTIIS